MPTYVADVRDRTGKARKEKIEANSPEIARSILSNRYPAVGKITPAGIDLDVYLAKLELMLAKVTVKDKAVFSRQFSVMINAGVAIVRCLGVLGEQASNPKMKKALTAISAEVQEGTNLSEAMKKHPAVFDQLYVSMIEAGEVGGVLDEVLNRLAKLLEDMAKLQNQIKSAMAYPVAVGSLAVLVFFAMTMFLIPVFAGIFDGLGVELPLLTQIMLNISAFMRSIGMLFIMISVPAAVFAFKKYYATPMGRLQVDQLMLKLPLFGDLNEKSAVARFCRVFGTLTRSGVPILNCLDIVQETSGNVVIANSIAAAKKEILEGGMLSIALEREKVFPPLALQMMTIGEETGELDSMMMKVADFYEDEVEQAVKALTSILEPLMMVAIAGLVGVILLSMYLPMFKIFDQLG
jgi:type IV pilus assembly protein PilC